MGRRVEKGVIRRQTAIYPVKPRDSLRSHAHHWLNRPLSYHLHHQLLPSNNFLLVIMAKLGSYERYNYLCAKIIQATNGLATQTHCFQLLASQWFSSAHE